MYPGLPPVVDEDLPAGQVLVQRVQPVLVAVVHVPLLPGHVTTALPGVDVEPVGGDQT